MKNNYKNFNFLNYIAAVILVILCIVQIVPDTSVKAETAENTGDITEIHTAAELVKASENQTGSYSAIRWKFYARRRTILSPC